MAPTHRAARRNRRRMWCLGLRLDPKEAAAAEAEAEAEAEAAATEATCARHRRHATVSSASLRSPPVGARRCTGPMPPASGPVAFQASEPRAERGAWCAVEAPERRAERGAMARMQTYSTSVSVASSCALLATRARVCTVFGEPEAFSMRSR
jgi:hypothetical protein